MKVLCIEVPRATKNGNGQIGVAWSNTPPLQLLCLGAAAESSDCTVTFRPANSDWADILNETAPSAPQRFVEQILAAGVDVVVLTVNVWNWPVAARLLRGLSAIPKDRHRPRVVVAGPHPTMFPQLVFGTGSVDALIVENHEESLAALLRNWNNQGGDRPAGVLLSASDEFPGVSGGQHYLSASASQLGKWPRWDAGLSTTETWGFPLEQQLHPANLPSYPAFDANALEEWLNGANEVLANLRNPVLSLDVPDAQWNRDFVDLLGKVSLKLIERERLAPNLAVRSTPAELLAPSVLPSLAVMNTTSIELEVSFETVGSANLFPENQLEDCLKKIKEVGLAGKTRLSCVLGLPDETLDQALETVRQTIALAVENQITGLNYEWWYNVPSSPYYRGSSSWEAMVNNDSNVWFLSDSVFHQLPTKITVDERRVLAGMVELSRGLHESIKFSGPYLN